MLINCPRKDLFEAIQTVGRAVSGRSSLPILSHIKIAPAGGDGLRLTATDLEMWMECSLPARVQAGLGGADAETGFTVPARVCAEMLGALPEADVVLDRPDGGNKVHVRCARSNYDLLGLPSDEFPSPPEVEPSATLVLPGALLKQMIRQVAFAVSTDETRALLTGVLMRFDGTDLRLVATDTHRLAVRAGKAAAGNGSGSAVVPARAMNEITRLAGDEDAITISLAAGQARFEVRRRAEDRDAEASPIDGLPGKYRSGATTMVTRLIEGQYPNYERVIPQAHERKWTLVRGDLAAAVKRIAIVARDNANRVVLETEGSHLALSAESGTVGSARDEVEVAREGDDITIAFNAKYLGDVLGAVDTEGVSFELTEPLRPGVVRPVGEGAVDYLCVLMPMQVL